jgi:hypothetical protein
MIGINLQILRMYSDIRANCQAFFALQNVGEQDGPKNDTLSVERERQWVGSWAGEECPR